MCVCFYMKTQVLTGLDVLPQDSDVLVPVGAALFVVEAESVEQLVLHSVVVEAALTVQRQRLRITTAANVGVTAEFVHINKKK